MLTAFTTGEVASMCCVAPRTVSKWVDSGLLEGYRIPGSQDRRVPDDVLRIFCRDFNMPVPAALKPTVLVALPTDDLRIRFTQAAQGRFEPICDLSSMFDLGLMIKDDRFRGMVVDCSCEANRAYVRLVRTYRCDVCIVGLNPRECSYDATPLQLNDQFPLPVDMKLVAERLITLMYGRKRAA